MWYAFYVSVFFKPALLLEQGLYEFHSHVPCGNV